MVVLMEYAAGVGVTTKRKGEEEPGLFAFPDYGDSGSVPISCRATKMRRLESAGTGHGVPAAAAVGAEGDVMMAEEPPAPSLGAAEGAVGAEGDVMMAEEPPAPSLGAAEGEERAVVVYGPAVDAARAGGRPGLLGQWRLRPWAPLSAGAEWIRDMLREADGCTVRAVLSSAQEEGGADLALVPWGAAHVPAEANQASTAAEAVDGEEDAEGTAAMDVEEEREHHQAQAVGAGCGEGYLCRWPQHCLAPPPLPAVRQATPAVWSW